ncbi:uncharacterized protein [Typha angustifolia]|uniref:uncharacterized protein n=1 Tax=Typha angustifolia TaxID=59011 RepID=UPI003C2C2B5F
MAEISGDGEEHDLSLFDPLDSENLDVSSYPLSLPSQPPDIRNWFSSYEYESPEFDLALAGEEENATQDPCQVSSPSRHQEKTKSSNQEHPREANDETLPKANRKQNLLEMSGDDLIDDCRQVSCNLEGREDIEAKSSPVKQASPASDGAEPLKDAATNGFISTKRRERSPQRHQMSQEKNHKRLERKVQLGLRSPLEDKTNCQFEVADEAPPECLGKWRCPRKNKPYVGPPLKQLRMEQWIHRVQ